MGYVSKQGEVFQHHFIKWLKDNSDAWVLLAVRIIPNRGVDDGWTVRFSPAKERPVELKIEAYAD